jgi:hypothetical protein
MSELATLVFHILRGTDSKILVPGYLRSQILPTIAPYLLLFALQVGARRNQYWFIVDTPNFLIEL